MKMRSAIFRVLAFISIGPAQVINITGVVKKNDGSGLEGVKVRLGKAGITTTTGQDGSFALKDGTGSIHQYHQTTFLKDYRLLLDGNRLVFTISEKSEVTVTAYDCNGRLLFSLGKTVSDRDHSITVPHFGSGIRIYRVIINGKPHTFKGVSGITTTRNHSSPWSEHSSAKQVNAAARIDDALIFIKQGYQLGRIALTNPDTSGVQISMTPLDTGTMTDSDGNVYRTVKIGTQDWTAENLRTTKYNDGSSIGSGYHFYNNLTDPAEKKKWGALYTQSAAKSGKLAPKGWHLPTNAEWDTLKNYLITHGYNYDGTTNENKIAKSMAAPTDWQDYGEPGAVGNDLSMNNASGFSALPAGWRYWGNNQFEQQKMRTYWWSATQYDMTYTCVCDLWYTNFDLDMTYYTIVECSVRLIKDN
jgi:uncharacterized protein (TIGR02145 family)